MLVKIVLSEMFFFLKYCWQEKRRTGKLNNSVNNRRNSCCEIEPSVDL